VYEEAGAGAGNNRPDGCELCLHACLLPTVEGFVKRWVSIAVLGCLGMATSVTAQSVDNPKDSDTRTPAAAVDVSSASSRAGVNSRPGDGDEAYLQIMSQHAQLGLTLARLAAGRGFRDEVRAFALRLVQERERDLEDLRRLEETLGTALKIALAVVAEDDPDTDAMLVRLEETTGKEFDTFFMSTILAHNDVAVHLSRNHTRFRFPVVQAFAQRVGQRHATDVRELRLMQRGS
jgi:uncharacterized protein (DUF305 family)